MTTATVLITMSIILIALGFVVHAIDDKTNFFLLLFITGFIVGVVGVFILDDEENSLEQKKQKLLEQIKEKQENKKIYLEIKMLEDSLKNM